MALEIRMDTPEDEPIPTSLRDEAARRLYEQHLEQVKHIIRQVLNARSRRREGTSDIFQQAVKSFAESNAVTVDPDNLLPRFLGFVHRKCINAAKKHQAQVRDVRRDVELVADKDDCEEGQVDPWADMPDGTMSQPLDAIIVRDELQQLSDEQLTVFFLRAAKYTFEQIGEELGCSESKARRIIKDMRDRFTVD